MQVPSGHRPASVHKGQLYFYDTTFLVPTSKTYSCNLNEGYVCRVRFIYYGGILDLSACHTTMIFIYQLLSTSICIWRVSYQLGKTWRDAWLIGALYPVRSITPSLICCICTSHGVSFEIQLYGVWFSELSNLGTPWHA